MAIEKRYSLSAAARMVGVDRATLRRWFEIDLGMRFAEGTSRGKYLLTEAQIEAVLRMRMERVGMWWVRPERQEKMKLERARAYLAGKKRIGDT